MQFGRVFWLGIGLDTDWAGRDVVGDVLKNAAGPVGSCEAHRSAHLVVAMATYCSSFLLVAMASNLQSIVCNRVFLSNQK